MFWYLAWGSKPGFTFNRTTHYQLDYGRFSHIYTEQGLCRPVSRSQVLHVCKGISFGKLDIFEYSTIHTSFFHNRFSPQKFLKKGHFSYSQNYLQFTRKFVSRRSVSGIIDRYSKLQCCCYCNSSAVVSRGTSLEKKKKNFRLVQLSLSC